MQKAELVAAVVESTGEKRATVQKVLEAITDNIVEAVRAGDTVRLIGFGSFEPVKRAQREGRHPRTGEAVTIAERRTLKFAVSPAVVEHLSRR